MSPSNGHNHLVYNVHLGQRLPRRRSDLSGAMVVDSVPAGQDHIEIDQKLTNTTFASGHQMCALSPHHKQQQPNNDAGTVSATPVLMSI